MWRPMLCHTSSRMNWNRLTVLRRIKLLRIIDFKPKLIMAKKHTQSHSTTIRAPNPQTLDLVVASASSHFYSLSIRRFELSWLVAVRFTFVCYFFHIFFSFHFSSFCERARERALAPVPRLDLRCIMVPYYRRIAADHTFCSFRRTIRVGFVRSSPACLPACLTDCSVLFFCVVLCSQLLLFIFVLYSWILLVYVLLCNSLTMCSLTERTHIGNYYWPISGEEKDRECCCCSS